MGKRLVKPVVKELVREGFNSMLVWVLKDNDANYFYEKLGGQKLDTTDFTIVGANLNETAYGWPDITVLTKEVSDDF
ncbi:GNAT family N-acetyltransferase [Lentibacillus halodurans]|nr:GNAT family N-acetyltransferase [Lentibacillus halodurans]